MTKQDMRLRNRRVRKQALLLRKQVMASINNRIIKPVLKEIKKEDNIDDNTVLSILNTAFVKSDLDHRVNTLRLNRNKADIKVYSKNYLNEVNSAYKKEKKRQAN